jgi:hypothetical protein
VYAFNSKIVHLIFVLPETGTQKVKLYFEASLSTLMGQGEIEFTRSVMNGVYKHHTLLYGVALICRDTFISYDSLISLAQVDMSE